MLILCPKYRHSVEELVTPPPFQGTSPFRGGVPYLAFKCYKQHIAMMDAPRVVPTGRENSQKLHRSANLFRPQYAYRRTAVEINLHCGAFFGKK